MAFLNPGVVLVVCAIAVVGLRLLWIELRQPAHIQEITTAFGAANFFSGVPQFDHAGRRFTFVKTTAHGYALYLCNADTGQKEVLFEGPIYLAGEHMHNLDLQAFPWSPDDSAMLCVVSNQLMVYPLDTRQPPTVVETNPVTEAVWLSPTKVAYLSSDDGLNKTSLGYAQKMADGKWERHEFLSQGDGISALSAIDEDTVAWLEDNVICRANLTDGLPKTNSVAAVAATGVAATNHLAPPGDGLVLWLDASTLKQADQSPVKWLADLSRSKNDAILNGQAPVFNGTNSPRELNGKPTIHFDSGGSTTNATGLKTRASPGMVGRAPRSLFVVMRRDAGQTMMVSMGDMALKGTAFGIEYGNSLFLPMVGPNTLRVSVSTGGVSTDWKILEAIHDGTSQMGYLNGLLSHTTTNRIYTADKALEIGWRTPTAGKNAKAADGDFAELLLYDRALDATERQQVEHYLGGKWFGQESMKSAVPFAWCVPGVAGLTGFSYSKTSGQFLLNGMDGDREILWQYDPQTETLTKVADNLSIVNGQWFGDGESAYFTGDSKRGSISEHNGIVLRNASGVEARRVLNSANILWFQVAAGGGELLFLGTPTNQPFAGIWRYDLASEKMQPAILYSDEPSDYAQNVRPENVTVDTPSGRKLLCTIYPPVNFNPHKKYPLLIGNTIFTAPTYRFQAPPWASAIANCGGYVVIVDRQNWFGGLDHWGADVLAAYNGLKHDLRIDGSQVFIFGSSVETSHMQDVLTSSPGLWKGVILLSPTQLPDFSHAKWLQNRPKILISDGSEENSGEELRKYQEDSLKSGVMVETLIHPGEFHNIVGNAAQRERTRAMVRFIFEE
jgi:hypothetical protein